MSEKKEKKFPVKRITQIALVTAVVCILGPLAFPIAISDVPVSLGILGIFLAVIVLGMKDGTISVALYILIGFIGIPVFAGFTSGIGKLAGPTGGYIVGYIFLALIAGFFLDHFKRKIPFAVLGMVLGTAVCYAFGTAWLAHGLNMTFFAALGIGVLPYIPFDLAKMIIALLVGIPVYKAVQKIR
ncbi:MAG: biotin transporter BioY [Lachnospiraceae bacterium]|nr:biotin transporter BioY [Lachnospiraceae bacterium]